MSILDELESKAKATDDSEWTAQAGHLEEGGQCAFGREHRLDDDDVDGECDPSDVEEDRAEKDAAFIAAANPQTVLAMVEVIRELMRWSGADRGLGDSATRAALAKLEGLS